MSEDLICEVDFNILNIKVDPGTFPEGDIENPAYSE